MALALTQILKNGHGIHLSSLPSAAEKESDGMPACAADLEPQTKSSDDGDLQNILFNLCSFCALDPCFPSHSLNTSVNPGLSPCVQTSANQSEMGPLPSPGSLVSFLSFNKFHKDSQLESSGFPGESDMLIIPVPKHNDHNSACLKHGWNGVSQYKTDGTDVDLDFRYPSHSQGDITFWPDSHFAAKPSVMQEEVIRMSSPALNLPHTCQTVQPGICIGIPNQHRSNAMIEDRIKEKFSKQAELESRAWRLKKRLKTLLGEHVLSHCSQQLEGLKNHFHLGDVTDDCKESIQYDSESPQAFSKPLFSLQEMSRVSPSLAEIREFSQTSQMLLKGLQEDLDSEATSCSSSDEEYEEDRIYDRSTFASCEKQWLEEKAELCSRWTWLQLRLVELEGRIQQLAELHVHLCSTKGGVVLAEAQPLTDRQIHHTLIREMAGLSCTTSDLDTEPCSPTHLLQNIERQSAQLNQIVNSLIPPLSFSPLSKQTDTSKAKKALTSFQSGEDGLVSGIYKRKRLWTRRLFKADVSCVCARTRPLATYHKRRLFTLNNSPPRSMNSRKSGSSSSSSLSSSSCSCGSSCDPLVLCSDPDCSSNSVLLSSSSSIRPHSVTALSSDSPTSLDLQKTSGREEWWQTPLVIDSNLCSPANYKRNSSTPRHNSYRYKQHERHHKNRVMGLSPIRSSDFTRSHRRKSIWRKRKRKYLHKLKDDRNILHQLFDFGESSDEVMEESYTQMTHRKDFARKRQRSRVYNINDIVIPMSYCKVERLLYKDILTPSWRLVDIQPLIESKAEDDEVEALEDEVFAQRHSGLEKNERWRWSIGGTRRRHHRRPTRSRSRLLGSVGVTCTIGEESSVKWSWTQLDTDEHLQPVECLPQAPWEPRIFPLDEAEEASLLFEEGGKVSSTASSPKCPTINTSLNQSDCAALHPDGQSESCT